MCGPHGVSLKFLNFFILYLPQINTEQTNFQRGCLDVNVIPDTDSLEAQEIFPTTTTTTIAEISKQRTTTTKMVNIPVAININEQDKSSNLDLRHQPLSKLGLRAIPPLSKLPPGTLTVGCV